MEQQQQSSSQQPLSKTDKDQLHKLAAQLRLLDRKDNHFSQLKRAYYAGGKKAVEEYLQPYYERLEKAGQILQKAANASKN